MLTRNTIKKVLLLGGVSLLAACQDLTVADENAADDERALTEPSAVEQVAKSALPIWYNRHHGSSDIYFWYPLIADEMTYSAALIRNVIPGTEPRLALKNDPLAEEVWIPRASWDAYQSGGANARDALKRVNDGLRIVTLDEGATAATDNTIRTHAWAKIMWGLNIGYMGLIHDQSALVTEHDQIPTGVDELVAFEVAHLKPYGEVTAAAIKSIEEGLTLINANPAFSLPASWVRAQTYTSAQLAQFANTLIARFLVYNARTPEERAAVNWQKVLTHTAAGLTFDFGPTLESGILTSTYYDRMQGNSRARADHNLIGPSDVSGSYQAWLALPLEQRNRILITTPDRRITGPTPTSNGSYFRARTVTDNNGFDVTRGTYHFSNYQWYRRAGSATTGQMVIASADENRLLRAEAMFRTGNLAEAANLINVTRTRARVIGTTNYPGLPAVTAAGVPASTAADPCVPRTRTGDCGTLLDALKYERQIELAGMDAWRAWHDFRGFGQLTPGTLVHMPIPGRYLVTLGIPLYTFGGVGGTGAAR